MLRGELLRHLLGSEGEADGRVIIDGFIARMEDFVSNAGPRNPTLHRYGLAQLCALRRELERLPGIENRRASDAT